MTGTGAYAEGLVLFGRQGCHLCDEALAAVEPLARELGVTVDVVDIEVDDELHSRYLEAIPVIVWRGAELARLDEFRAAGFERRLRDFVRGGY